MALLIISGGLSSAIAGDLSSHALPNPYLTPGAVFQGVTAADICVPGYSTSVRHVSQAVREQVFTAYGLMEGNHTGYCSGDQGCELDHLISLELGGSNEAANLFPQPYDGEWNAHVKDRLENRLHKLVCSGDLPLAEAQRAISTDWVAAYRRLACSKSPRQRDMSIISII